MSARCRASPNPPAGRHSSVSLVCGSPPAGRDRELCGASRSVRMHIKRLRRKFEARDAEFDMVETLYGIAYRFKDV
jgi:hypothetical protein